MMFYGLGFILLLVVYETIARIQINNRQRSNCHSSEFFKL